MATIKRIISDEVQPARNKSVGDIARGAIYISLDDELHSKSAGSHDMKWDNLGRPLFGAAIKELRQNLPKNQYDDNKENPSS